MKEGLTQHDIKKGPLHKVFEDSFDAKPVYHRQFLLAKDKLQTFKPCAREVAISATLGGL